MREKKLDVRRVRQLQQVLVNYYIIMKKFKLKKITRIRSKLKSLDRPRLVVFRSNLHIYMQVIAQKTGKVLAVASDKDLSGDDLSLSNVEKAGKIGELLAERAKKVKVSKVSFDRGRFTYHGIIKALAEGARKGGLDF